MKEQELKNKIVVAGGAVSLVILGMAIQRYKNSIKFTLINFACRFPVIGNWLAERHKDKYLRDEPPRRDTPRRRHSDSSFVTINLDSPYTTPRNIDTPRESGITRILWRTSSQESLDTPRSRGSVNHSQ